MATYKLSTFKSPRFQWVLVFHQKKPMDIKVLYMDELFSVFCTEQPSAPFYLTVTILLLIIKAIEYKHTYIPCWHMQQELYTSLLTSRWAWDWCSCHVFAESIIFCTGMVRAADQESCQSWRTASNYPFRGLETLEVPTKIQEPCLLGSQVCISSLHKICCCFLWYRNTQK